MNDAAQTEALIRIEAWFGELDGSLTAFSGGVDSARPIPFPTFPRQEWDWRGRGLLETVGPANSHRLLQAV